MHVKFVDYFVDPFSGVALRFFPIETLKENIVSGIYVNSESGESYALYEGVPIFLKHSIPKSFLKKFSSKIEEIKLQMPYINAHSTEENSNWSFSLEWEAHKSQELDTTWGMTTKSRYEQFLLETNSSELENQGKLILDAGCGNGMLTEYIANRGSIVFGIDFSTSVFRAEKERQSEDACFIQGDLQYLPFKNELLEIVISNGVIHHTPDTEKTFKEIAKKIKPQGKFYLWLYSRKGSLPWQTKRLFFDLMRIIFSRTPAFIQKMAVAFFSHTLYFIYLIIGKELDKKTLFIDMYDSITPRWRHYHTPEEISRWFFEAGFGPLTLTHWKNRFGFGSVASKTKIINTPGERYTG